MTRRDDGDTEKPRGRDEVVDALLHAAAKLFGERGPASVSLRDVAKEANVNVGLIHRHIGSKEELVAAVLRERPGFWDLQHLTAELTPAQLLQDVFVTDPGFAAITDIHARMILDGYRIRSFQDHFPVIDWLVERLGGELPDEEARLRTALMVAIVTGWRLFGAEYLSVVGLDGMTPDEVARLSAPALAALVDAPASRPSHALERDGTLGRRTGSARTRPPDHPPAIS